MEEGLDTKMVKNSADYVKAMESNVQSNQVTVNVCETGADLKLVISCNKS